MDEGPISRFCALIVCPTLGPIAQRPAPLLEIVDKPMVVHVIEALVALKITEIELFVSDEPYLVEQTLGDGSRWGARLRIHLPMERMTPFTHILPLLHTIKGEKVIVGRGDLLPVSLPSDNGEEILCDSKGRWLGWGLFPISELLGAKKTQDFSTFVTHCSSTYSCRRVDFFSTRDAKEWKESNLKAITFSKPPVRFSTTSHLIQPGVWGAKGVKLDPRATLFPPLYIGEGTRIGAGVRLGPNSVIGRCSMIDRGAAVTSSVVLSKSYVGCNLEVREALVDGNHLYDFKIGTKVSFEEPFLLASTERNTTLWGELFERVIAFVCLVFTFPIRCFQKTELREVVRLPGGEKTFSYHKGGRLAGLKNVVKGEMRLFGLRPRSVEEVNALPKRWKETYCSGRVGLFQIEDLEGSVERDLEELRESIVVGKKMWNRGVWHALCCLFRSKGGR